MKNIWIICRKELKSYFSSPIAYLLMALFAVVFGFFFYSTTAFFVSRGMEASMMGRGGPMNVSEWVVRPLLSNAAILGLFLIPMMSMRLFAEEKRSGTLELLLTSPVRDLEIILGKWLGALLMFLCLLAVAGLDMGLLFLYGNPELKPLLVGFLGLILQGGAMLAVGTFISSTTKNQIIAGGATFAVLLLLWVLDWISAYETSTFSKVMGYMSITSHFESFAKGVLETKDVLFYLSLTFLGLFLTDRSMESLRWRA